MLFYEKDRQVAPSHHNRSLYVTASIRNFKLRRTMVDPGSSLNIIPLSTLKAVGILRERIAKQHVEVSELPLKSPLETFNGFRTASKKG